MKRILAIFAGVVLAGAAMADTPETGTIVWDAGIEIEERGSNSQINQLGIEFTPVMRTASGELILSGQPVAKQHFFGTSRLSEKATFRELDLPAGQYVLSRVTFREGYQSFCVLEKTLLVDVEPGETKYVGQFVMNEPSGSPNFDRASFVPIEGLNRSLKVAQDSKYWKFGEASLAELEKVSMSSHSNDCSKQSISVKGW